MLFSMMFGRWATTFPLLVILGVSLQVQAQRYELPTANGQQLRIETSAALTPQGHAALAQLQAELPAQWALLQDRNYWPIAEQYATTGQWPAPADLLQRALTLCEAWWQQQQNYHCRFGQARRTWQQMLDGTDHHDTFQKPDRVSARRQARQVLQPSAQFLPDLQDFAVAVLLDDVWQRSQQIWPNAEQLQLHFDSWHAVRGKPLLLAASDPLLRVALRDAVLVRFDSAQQQSTAVGRYTHLWHPTEAWPAIFAPDVHAIAPSFSQAWLTAHAIAAAPPVQRQRYSQHAAALWQFSGTSQRSIQQASELWYQHLNATPLQQAVAVELRIELPNPSPGSKSPYVSAWLSNDQGWQQQLLLVGEQTRWYSELRSWWRALKSYVGPMESHSQSMQLAQLTDQWAGATRKSTVLQHVWQARLHTGEPIPEGDYLLIVEAAREGGGREVLKIPLHWPLPDQQLLQQQGHTELGRVTLQRH